VNGGPDPVQKGQAAYQTMGSYARVLPVIVFQGAADTVIYPINGEQVIQQFISTDDWADDGSHNGSIPTTRSSTAGGQVPGGHSYSIDYYQNGHGAELMQRWLVNGMGHAWSGGSGEPYTDPQGPDASAYTWSFFAAHPKP
jgi:poly(3-hydroxybutyrate) depolymerase